MVIGGTVVKNLPVQEMQEMWVRSLGREGSLEKKMATYFSILGWEIPCTEDPGWVTVHGVTKTQTRLNN